MARNFSEFEELAKHLTNSITSKSGSRYIPYYSPTDEIAITEIFYYTYINLPVSGILLLMTIIILFHLRCEGFCQKYGFMTSYTVVDLFAIHIPGIVIFVFLFNSKQYPECSICYIYSISSQMIPAFCFTLSQWLKVGQAWQRFIIVYKPMSYTNYLNKISITIFVVTTIVLASTVAVFELFAINYFDVRFVDLNALTARTACKRSPDNWFPNAARTFEVLSKIVSSILPLILFVTLSIFLILKLWKQTKFRKRFSTTASHDYQLLIVVVILNTFFAFTSVVNIVYTILDENVNALSSLSTASTLLYFASVPITVFSYGMLSAKLRSIFCRCIKRPV